MEKYIIVDNDDKHYRVQLDSETGLVLDPATMYRKGNEVSEEEALEFYDRKRREHDNRKSNIVWC